MKGDKAFLDTNLFIYAIDLDSGDKKRIADELIASMILDAQGIISFQVVQEFFNTAVRKRQYAMDKALRFSKNFLFPLWEIYPSRDLYLESLALQERYRYSFYDSLIIAAALEGKCKTLYSEDLQHQQKIEGLMIINPFA